MIDCKLAESLQERYLETRADADWEALRKEVESIATGLIYYFLRKTGGFIHNVPEMAYECSTRFMEMYSPKKKNPNWRCQSFSYRVGCEAKYFLYNKKQRQVDMEVQLDPNFEYEAPARQEKESLDRVIEDLMEDSEYWRNILLDCYKARSFKAFITSIAQYQDREFCETHILRLKDLYKNTRKKRRQGK